MLVSRVGVAIGLIYLSLGIFSVGLGQVQNPNDPKNRVPGSLPKQAPQRLHVNGVTVTFFGWRSGFTPYGGVFHKNAFRFQRYVLNYTDDAIIFLSPFYLYPNLPPFIQDSSEDQTDIQILPSEDSQPAPAEPSSTVDPSKIVPDPEGKPKQGDMDSDTAVQDLKLAWTSLDMAALQRLCPKTGVVKVSVADQSYSLDAKDFADLIKDGVNGTVTSKWSIVDMHVEDDEIDLKVLHTFTDPWDKLRSVYQTYKLEKDEVGFVIRQFGSDPYNSDSEGNVSSR